MKKPYQDVWRDGRLVEAGRRDCAGRYDVISALLGDELGRGFSVADVGGWDGYFPVRLAEDFGAVAENIDRRDIDLPCHRRLDVNARTVHRVGYHDAILCLSVLHHMKDWRGVYEGLKRQCLLLVLEVCHPDEATGDLSPVMRETAHRIAAIHATVAADAAALLTDTPCLDRPAVRRPMYLVRQGVAGIVEAGSGQAAGLMDTCGPAEWDELGYVPVPGTLNVAVTEAGQKWLKSRPGVTAPGLKRSPHYVPVRVDDVDCHVHFARSPRSRPQKVIELVAPVSFRDSGYRDGDLVKVVPR